MRRILVAAVFALVIFSAAAALLAPALRPGSAFQAGRAMAEDVRPPGTQAASKMNATAAVQRPHEGPGNRWGADYFPNVPVTNQHGKALRFYDDVIKGRVVVISFVYTSCTDICPLTTARMAQLEDKLGDIVGRSVFFVSMSVDPEVDTPERMRAFADAFGAGPGWQFLTGKPEYVRAINYKLGDRSQRRLSDHRNEIVIGNDATGEWARDSVFGELDRLAMTIRAMDTTWRDTVHIPGTEQVSNAAIPLSERPGQALFRKICAPCHTIGVGDRVGPDLRGVTARRDRSWLMSFIRNPRARHAARDPIALELAARFPAVRMPTLGLGEVDAADMIAYLDSETARLAGEGQGREPPSEQHPRN